MIRENKLKSDIVFFAHGHNETERYLPIMVGLKEKGITSLLFYQNYDFKDGLSLVQQRILKEYGLNVADYSYFFKRDIALILVTSFLKFFRDDLKIHYLYNKFSGLRSMLIKRKMNKTLADRVIKEISPKAGFFDTIPLVEYRDYPYGSYYIKERLKQLGIKDLCIHHGGTGHLLEIKEKEIKTMDYCKIYVPNDHEKEVCRASCVTSDTEILSLGDPRFDRSWKECLKKIFSEDISKRMSSISRAGGLKILYLSPNLEHLGKESEKYENFLNISKVVNKILGAILLIKPHPRYRNERQIRRIMKEVGVKKFLILENDPLVCYADHVDFIVSSTSSALHDVLPEAYEKVVIYDDFSESIGVVNIFRKNFLYINNYDDLLQFFTNTGEGRGKTGNLSKKDGIAKFCEKWTAGGMALDSVISRITEDIQGELNKTAGNISIG